MNHPRYLAPAFLWDGHRQLPGQLELREDRVIFLFDDFRGSHLTLAIPVGEIALVEEFLLFDIARHGLRIEGRTGKVDCFVLDEPGVFKEKIREQLRGE